MSLSADRYRTLAGETEAQIGVIVKECKLEPQADVALHIIIARMMESLDVMNGKAAGQPADALANLARAFNDYGTYFDHPGFQPLALGH